MVVTLVPSGASCFVDIKRPIRCFRRHSTASSRRRQSPYNGSVAGNIYQVPRVNRRLFGASFTNQRRASHLSQTAPDQPTKDIGRSPGTDVSCQSTATTQPLPLPTSVPCIVEAREATASCIVGSVTVAPTATQTGTVSFDHPKGREADGSKQSREGRASHRHMTSQLSQHVLETPPTSTTTVLVTHSRIVTRPNENETGSRKISKTTVSTSTTTTVVVAAQATSPTRIISNATTPTLSKAIPVTGSRSSSHSSPNSSKHSSTPLPTQSSKHAPTSSKAHTGFHTSNSSKSTPSTASKTWVTGNHIPSTPSATSQTETPLAGTQANGSRIAKIVFPSIFGAIALAIIVFTVIICLRRHNRKKRKRRSRAQNSLLPLPSDPPSLPPMIHQRTSTSACLFPSPTLPFLSPAPSLPRPPPIPTKHAGRPVIRPLVPTRRPLIPAIRITRPTSLANSPLLEGMTLPPHPRRPQISRQSSYTTISTASMDSEGQRRVSEAFDLE